MITISACMIVKNEAEVLARGLDSLKGIYDELIIVDTGSSDQTKSIALQYTDKVYDYEWKDDFSAARNYMFSKANMDYIYVADADEVLEAEQREKFLALKQTLLEEIEIVQMYYANQLQYNTTYNYDCEYRPKLYKRQRKFKWIDPIHESVRLEPVIYDSDIVVSHQPTSCHAFRDFQTFRKSLAKHGELSVKLQEMYARELYIAGDDNDFGQAHSYFKELSVQVSDTKRLRKIFSILIRCARIEKDILSLMTYSNKVFAGGLATSEICVELGEFYYEKAMYEEAVLWFYNAAYECESELNIHYQKKIPLTRLSDCYHCLGDEKNENYYREMISE